MPELEVRTMDERLVEQLKLFDKYIAYLEMLSKKPREIFMAAEKWER